MAKWVDLEHKLWQGLQSSNFIETKILVAFSGGVDSMALLYALHRVKKQKILACHVHHGPSENLETTEYRNHAAAFCESFCSEHGVPFTLYRMTESPPHNVTHAPEDRNATLAPQVPAAAGESVRELKSEEELRRFRYEALEKVAAADGAELIALGHHQEDLLETRLLRLIRGTGPQGLEAMRALQGSRFRPFLQVSKKMLQDYLQIFNLNALEDPSNQQTDPLRNWLRQEWLPALEHRQAGALQSLARSLELCVEALNSPMDFVKDEIARAFNDATTLSRLGFMSLRREDQKTALARLVFNKNKRDFTQGNVEEVIKRLDNPQKELMFRTGGVDWYVNAQQISIQSPSADDEKD